MKMRFAISQAFLFVMSSAQKWFLAFGAYEMLDMPIFAQSRHHAFFDRPSTSAANRYAHFIVTT
jgi:hypothetical protein